MTELRYRGFLMGEGEWERGRGWGNKYLGTGAEEKKREAGRRGEMGERENDREAQSGKETRKGLGGYS